MKKVVLALLAIVLLIVVVACKPDYQYINSYNAVPISHIAAINKLGDVSRIFSSGQSRTVTLYEVRSTRFYTGQEMVMYGHNVRFEADIVEYDSIDPVVTSYVEGLETCNALMHQSYQMFEAGEVDPNKKYVEFASYIDIETGESLLHEIRIFQGDFMDTFRTSCFYAKAVTFSPDLVVDYERQVNVYTGEQVNYGIQQGNIVEVNNRQMREVKGRNAEFSYLGDVNRVFAWYDGEEFDYIHMFGRDDFLAECYLVELNSLSPAATDAFDGVAENGLHQREWEIVSVPGKEYVEVCHYTDDSEGTEWYEYGLRVRHMENTTYGYFTKCIRNI